MTAARATEDSKADGKALPCPVVQAAVNCMAPLSVLLGIFLYLRSVVLMHSNQ